MNVLTVRSLGPTESPAGGGRPAAPGPFRRRNALVAGLIPALCLLCAPRAAGAMDDGGGQEGDEGDEGEGLGISGLVILDNAFGIGSFYRKDSRLYLPVLSFIGTWTVPGTADAATGDAGITLSGRQDFTLYGLGALDASTDLDPDETVRPADTLVTLGLGQLAKDTFLTDIALGGSIRLYLPVSPESQAQTLIVGVGPGLDLSRKFGFVTLSAGSRARYNFLRFDNSVVFTRTAASDGGAVQGCIPRGSSKQAAFREDEVACGGAQNYDWRFYNFFAADFVILPKLTANISLYIINSFGIPIPVDDFTSDITLRTNNETQRDSTWGIAELAYQATDHLGLSVGISSLQTAKTLDGERLRFPWWDVDAPQGNTTSLYVDLTGSF